MARSFQDLSLDEIREKYSDPALAVSGQLLSKLQRDPRAGAQKLYRTLARRAEEQKAERLRLDAMLHFERLLWKQGVCHIAGVDEVGMGPLAGPVVAAAVIFPPDTEIKGIDDSKALDEATRLRLEVEIRKQAAAVAIGVIDVEEIDRLNIHHAGLRAMQLALANLAIVRSMCSSTAAPFRASRSRKAASTRATASISRSLAPRSLPRCIATA